MLRSRHNYGRCRPHIYRCLNRRQQQVDEHYINMQTFTDNISSKPTFHRTPFSFLGTCA